MKALVLSAQSPIRRSSLGRGFLLTPLSLLLVCFAFMQKAQSAEPDTILPNGNTAEGSGVLVSLTTGVWNSGFGFQALNHDTSGGNNSAIGFRALFSNTSGSNNTATGVNALFGNTTGWYNNAVGASALANNTEGDYNTASGYGALFRNTTGSNNTANGKAALYNNTAGSNNTALGTGAGQNLASGNYNIYIGNPGGFSTESNTIRIGTNGVQNRTFIRGIRAVATGLSNAVPVLIDGNSQLGTQSSSRRFKAEIRPMRQTSEAILALKPVTFHYKSDTQDTPQFGLIAEEVAEVNPDLVVRDENGEIYTVRYDAVNAMLLNEFLKAHRKLQEQGVEMQKEKAATSQLKITVAKQEATIAALKSTVAQQEKGMETLATSLKEQATQIQKVSARLEMSKTGPEMVVND
jgi:uncharacterized coiled-coil protein SlyX